MILLVEHATSDNPLRQQEYEETLGRNRASGLFSHVEVMLGRNSIREILAWANRFAGEIVVVANADIWFDDSLRKAEDIGPNEVLALTRWEPEGFGGLEYSQDSWIFRAPLKEIPADFTLGIRGSDGRLAALFEDAGYAVSNPSLTIKTHHCHQSRVRTYGISDWVQGRYLSITPTERVPRTAFKVCVYTIAKDEQQFVDRWADSCKEADYRVIVDTGSTDSTVEYARQAGVTAHEIVISPWRFDDARNASLALLPADATMCVQLDMDEVLLPGWREELEKAHVAGATRVWYNYAWSMKKDGTPDHWFRTAKIHARRGYRWSFPCHEQVGPAAEEKRFESSLWIHHLPDGGKSRFQYLPLLELSAKENPDNATVLFYLGREYTFHNRPDDAARTFERMLGRSTWNVEKAHACIFLSRCRPSDRMTWLNRALVEAPDRREVLLELSSCHADLKQWQLSFAYAMAALDQKRRPADYLVESAAWSWKPYDLAATAAFYLGLERKAIELGAQAISLNPDDARLKTNMGFYKEAVA